MKILITNDDGIDAEGLQVLTDIARGLTSAENIITVGPALNNQGLTCHNLYKTDPMRKT